MRKAALLLLVSSLACSHAREPLEVERFDRPDAAAEYDAMKRGITESTDVSALYARAYARREAMRQYSTVEDRVIERSRGARVDASAATVAGWQFLGPGNIGGRTRVLLFDPADSKVMYAGAVSGGVWKTTNAGASWTPVGDRLANLAVNSLALDPHDHLTLWAGTGEGYFREDVRGTALPLRGDGIFVTHDGGASWTQLPATAGNPDFQWVSDLAVSAHDSNRLYAATRTGVWRTGDGGATWSRVLPTTVKGGCLDLALRPDAEGDYLFASCGVFEQATVYRNTDAQEGGGDWLSVLSEPGMSRTTLAIAPSNPSIVYALAASNNIGGGGTTQNLQALYRSTSNGDPGSWQVRVAANDSDPVARTLLSNTIAAVETRCNGGNTDGDWVPMGWHCNVVAVDPTNADRVWAAGVDLFRSDDGGRTWGEASYWWTDGSRPTFVHADQHAIVFDPHYNGTSNQTMFVTNDGGVYRTDNANAAVAQGIGGACNSNRSSVHWTPLVNSYGATQFYHGAVFPDGTRFGGGAQDNGTSFGTTGGGPNAWARTWGGDGAFVAVDQVDPNFVYAESQNGNTVFSKDGGQNFMPWAPIGGGDDSRFLFVAPMALDPNQHERLWIGGTTLQREDRSPMNLGSFSIVSPTLKGKVSAIAIAPGNSDAVLAGTSSGSIYRSTNATATMPAWTETHPRDGFVSSLAYDPLDANTVYATYSLFGGTHVWRSSDGGSSWSPLDGSGDGALPDLPVHSIAVDAVRNRLYLGTDLGVFVSLDRGEHWLVENSGFASVVTELVTIGQGANGPAIYAFTHGRGVWRAPLSFSSPRRRAAAH